MAYDFATGEKTLEIKGTQEYGLTRLSSNGDLGVIMKDGTAKLFNSDGKELFSGFDMYNSSEELYGLYDMHYNGGEAQFARSGIYTAQGEKIADRSDGSDGGNTMYALDFEREGIAVFDERAKEIAFIPIDLDNLDMRRGLYNGVLCLGMRDGFTLYYTPTGRRL